MPITTHTEPSNSALSVPSFDYGTLGNAFEARSIEIDELTPQLPEEIIYKMILEILRINFHCIAMICRSGFKEGDGFRFVLLEQMAESQTIEEFISHFVKIIQLPNLHYAYSPIMRRLAEAYKKISPDMSYESYSILLLNVFVIALSQQDENGRDVFSEKRNLEIREKYGIQNSDLIS